MLKDNLRFLELSKDFAVEQLENGDYEVSFKCREDYDIEQLRKMMEFVKLLKDKK